MYLVFVCLVLLTCLVRLSQNVYYVCVQCSAIKREKKNCVDKWLMMDILMNCCLFCSINFIIHCRWWFFFSLLFSLASILSHRLKRMPFFVCRQQENERQGDFRWHETSTSNAFKFGLFSRPSVIHYLASMIKYESPNKLFLLLLLKCEVFLMSRKLFHLSNLFLPNQ